MLLSVFSALGPISNPTPPTAALTEFFHADTVASDHPLPYKLFWAVCHLFPQRWRTLTYSVSGNHWPGEPRDMFKTTSARKFKSCVFEPPTRRVFSINTSSSNTLVLFYQISSQQQHTPFSVNQQERKATPWMGLANIHIQ